MTDMTPASPNQASKPKPRPRPQVMKLTEAAAQRITELTKRADSEIVGLRVGINPKYFIAVTQEVNQVSPAAATHVQYFFDLIITAFQQLVKQVDINISEGLPKG